MKKLKIVLILDNKDREYAYLQLLKKTLTKILKADVSIVGSVAELQRTYYLLYKIQPHIVFLSQIAEESMRNLSLYIRQSGGLVFVLPAEITIIPKISSLIVNKYLLYDKYLDAIFLPGGRMQQLYKDSDICPKKMFTVGSPKIDVLINKTSNEFLKKQVFLKKYKINQLNHNLFIFTSFVTIPTEYISTNKSFKGNKNEIINNNIYTLKNKKIYIKTIAKLVNDFPNINIILKTHPLEDTNDYLNINAPNFYILPKISLYNCLASIDLAIHWNSTVATECWIKGIKTLQFVPFMEKSSLSEYRLGNPLVSSYEELVININIYLQKNMEKGNLSFQKQYLRDNYYKLDGKASQRISKIIMEKYLTIERQIKYRINFNKQFYFILIIQKLFGLRASRFIIRLFLKKFYPEYAIKNYINEIN